jgi:hypothetical protein
MQETHLSHPKSDQAFPILVGVKVDGKEKMATGVLKFMQHSISAFSNPDVFTFDSSRVDWPFRVNLLVALDG